MRLCESGRRCNCSPPSEAAISLPEGHIRRTTRGHAGGADPWVGFMEQPPQGELPCIDVE